MYQNNNPYIDNAPSASPIYNNYGQPYPNPNYYDPDAYKQNPYQPSPMQVSNILLR